MNKTLSKLKSIFLMPMNALGISDDEANKQWSAIDMRVLEALDQYKLDEILPMLSVSQDLTALRQDTELLKDALARCEYEISNLKKSLLTYQNGSAHKFPLFN